MFEYLMPPLFLRTSPAPCSTKASTRRRRGRSSTAGKRASPGASPSPLLPLSIRRGYQYQAFGVPGLGLKRGLGKDLVIAPYADRVWG